MPTNNRIYYATQCAAIAGDGIGAYTIAHKVFGLQSIGITTTFNLEQAFEIGQLSLYENAEQLPDVEVTLEKLIDGHQLLYHKATPGAVSNSLSGRSTQKCSVAVGIFTDSQDSASGAPVAECIMSGLFCSSLSYTFPREGFATESVTLIGNNKVWNTSAPFALGATLFLNTDTPVPNVLVAGSGSNARRQDVRFDFGGGTLSLDANSMVTNSLNIGTILPPDLPGINASGVNIDNGVAFAAHIGSISVSTNLGREPLYELGRRGPYYRFVTFPIEVTTAIEVTSSAGDQVSATEAGILGNGNNLRDRTIKVSTKDGTFLNLGLKNKLASVSQTGGDATGGNVTVTYNYTNFNDLIVIHPKSSAE